MTIAQADILEYYLRSKDFVLDVVVHERTGDCIVSFVAKVDRDKIVEAMSYFSYDDEETLQLVPERTGRALNHQYEDKLWGMVLQRGIERLFLPAPVRAVLTVIKSIKFIAKVIKSLSRGKLEVSVLDATAITVSMLRNDFATAGSIIFLLNVGDMLEEWTHRKSVDDLARSMTLKVDKVWLKTTGEDVLVPINQIKLGDKIVVRTSNIIPLDGKVVDGTAIVNQSAMTGESVPVMKEEGGYVYAGTVVEEGSLTIEVMKLSGSGKYDQIVKMIEESEKLKSGTEEKAYHMADRLVPFGLGGTVLTYLITGNANRALSFLMVDFSCALKLAMPLSVLSAINEASKYDISVKGGKFMEAVSEAKTIVFDKTGTLTHGTPKVEKIITFDNTPEDDALKVAACLEEHYPHSIANAVVEEARRRGLEHNEMHSEVQYVVAHGIKSTIDGKTALIGSYHFIFEDEGFSISDEEKKTISEIPEQYSKLYLAYDGRLKAILLIFDPPRLEAKDIISRLHDLGFEKVAMMTGDSESTAKMVAEELCIDEYHAEVLPEDKAAFIKKEHEAGRKVVMIGDGVNDTPALSEADCGVAISDGAAIAREVADVTITGEDLYSLVTLRELSNALMSRIHNNYTAIISFNMTLIALGVLGVLTPAVSSLLHNTSTIVFGFHSMTKLLDDKKKD